MTHDAIAVRFLCNKCNVRIKYTVENGSKSKRFRMGFYTTWLSIIKMVDCSLKYQEVVDRFDKIRNDPYSLISNNCKIFARRFMHSIDPCPSMLLLYFDVFIADPMWNLLKTIIYIRKHFGHRYFRIKGGYHIMCCANCEVIESHLRRPRKTIITKKDGECERIIMLRKSDETEKINPGFEVLDLTNNAEIVICFSTLLNMVKFRDETKLVMNEHRKLANLVSFYTFKAKF